MTNGLGGYACGTVAGANTRRYHAFLMASLAPPVERTLLVAKVDVSVRYSGRLYHLSANEFAGGAVDPRGFVHLESFTVSNGVPAWRYALADALLEQRIFMAPGANTSYLRLELLRASAPLQVELKPLVTYRDYHSHGRGPQPFQVTAGEDVCTVERADGAPLYRLAVSSGRYIPADLWYWNFLHREESARGLDALEDLWGPGTFTAELTTRRPLSFTATAATCEPPAGEDVLAALVVRAQRRVAALPRSAPPWVQALAIASDQFLVQRGDESAAAASVIAGYPWFTDWGRDTMIALPGLTTVLGRFDTAAAILRTYARFVERGMLPNRFPEAGATPEYNTADATLWLFQAVSESLGAQRDPDLAREMFPVLAAIVHAHVAGTRYGIRVDPDDGLLRAGEPGTQLTWMDAKHGGHAVTPRVGKPVEINALWLNALEVTARLAGRVRDSAEKRFCSGLLKRAGGGFARFWNAERGCLYDVLDTPGSTRAAPSHDAQIRPNQIFAVALPYCVLPPEQMRAVVDTCAREHLTSHGLRSLSPEDPAYVGRYEGAPAQRDGAYHQGTVWSWLLGPFARAHYRVYGNALRAQAFLAPIEQHLAAACVGSVSEIFDGDAPHSARGCFAQAWSVAEILRAWVYLERQKSKS
ncbi:MAG: amylo-alpha-1,6-glucosidase [Pseudomonadota bacterium]|nr:amylo-alpha-1,6-glucosidase [Pseudomonadota bacterium]